MQVTVNQLYKALGKLIDSGAGRCQVCINKNTFNHVLEGDGCVILPVRNCDIEVIELMDGDGFCETRTDGTVKQRKVAVLTGGE